MSVSLLFFYIFEDMKGASMGSVLLFYSKYLNPLTFLNKWALNLSKLIAHTRLSFFIVKNKPVVLSCWIVLVLNRLGLKLHST